MQLHQKPFEIGLLPNKCKMNRIIECRRGWHRQYGKELDGYDRPRPRLDSLFYAAFKGIREMYVCVPHKSFLIERDGVIWKKKGKWGLPNDQKIRKASHEQLTHSQPV